MIDLNPCQQLRDLYSQIPGIEELRQRFRAAVSQGTDKAMKKFAAEIEAEKLYRNHLVEQYQNQVKLLLMEWYDDFDFIRSLSFDEDQRVVIDGHLNLWGQQRKYFPGLIKTVKGNLDLRKNSLEHLDYLEVVEGDCLLNENYRLRSLERLSSVGDKLNIRETQVESCPSLVRVSGSFVAEGVKSLQTLPQLFAVDGNLNLKDSGIRNLPSLFYIEGAFNANGAENLAIVPNLGYAGSIMVKGTQIRAFPELRHVRKNLDATGLESLISIPKLEQVDQSLLLKGTSIADLTSLNKVGGNFDLQLVQTIKTLKVSEVGGDFLLSDSSLESLAELEKVNGSFNAFNSALRDLSSLREVFGNFDISHTELDCLPKLNYVHGKLDLSALNMQSFRRLFPELAFIGKNSIGISVATTQRSIQEELERLHQKGGLFVTGKIILV
jgi:hypothetical protein